ncbi:MAG: TOMM precursor leader peptide-binding protein [Desulfobacteraceae bacterium]|nr:TOMM precursor leader peptide-binding protein [Desulfobacteraceae bacterium]
MKLQIPAKPRLRQSFVAEAIEPDVLLLMGEYRQYVFQGRAFVRMLPYLDGAHTIGEMLGGLGAEVSIQEVYGALFQLIQKGCLIENDGKPVLEHRAFWDQLNADAAQVEKRLESLEVTVQSFCGLDAGVLAENLRQNGIRTGGNGELLVLAVEDYLQPELEKINDERLSAGTPWLLLKPHGMTLWVGPLFRPGRTACWKCLRQRLAANRQVEAYIRNRTDVPVSFRRSRGSLPVSVDAAMHMAVMEVAKSLVDGRGIALEDKIATMDLASLEWREHVLVRRPQCPACGNADVLETGPIELHSRKKAEGHRALGPSETFERFKHHISPITGVVTSLITRESSLFGKSYSCVAGHYFPIIRDDIKLLRVCMFARSGGKGDTLAQAKTSTLCESIERYSGISWGEEKRITASFSELAPRAYRIGELTMFSEKQYRNRDETNPKALSSKEFVPPPLDDETKIAWSPAWSLTHERSVYLPTGFCFYGHQDAVEPYCLCDSNGSAAGNTIEEAILQGFLELVERDAVALWWYNRVRRPPVDVDSFHLPYWDEMKRLYTERLRRDLHVIDITTDMKIPTFVVISRALDRATEDIIVSPGSHLDPRTAMIRALVEANQYLPALIHAPGEVMPEYVQQLSPPENLAWWKTATYERDPYLVADPRAAMKRFEDFAMLASEDLMEDVRTCIDITRERGFELLVVDQTRPDIGLPVVKVVVPGLRHFWRRLSPGRLYETPVELGWRDGCASEEEMNPVACFV